MEGIQISKKWYDHYELQARLSQSPGKRHKDDLCNHMTGEETF